MLAETLAMRTEYSAILGELKTARDDFARETVRLWEELAALRADFNRLIGEVAALRADFNRLAQEMAKRFEELRIDFHRGLTALGARWGLMTEQAFREGMRGVLEDLGLGRVSRWRHDDPEGVVLGYPGTVEVDLAVTDTTHYLIELKSSASDADVAKLARIGLVYEKGAGVKPQLAIVTPFITEQGLEASRRLGVKVYSGSPASL